MRRLLILALLALGATACEKTPPPPSIVDGVLEPVANPHGDPMPLPDLEQQSRVGRSPRRITVDQLGRSIEVATGRPWSQLKDRAASMGRADYALVNIESTEPNLVFAKFLEDGAREVCLTQASDEVRALVPRVLTRTLPGTTTVGNLRTLTDPQVRELLVYLSTRFWGAPLQGEELTRWAGFFTQAATRAETINQRHQAVAAVCIAMMTDSRFLTY